MTRARDTYTFSAGPAMLPDEVLRQIQVDLQDWRGSGFSLLEASQWDADLLEMLGHVEADLRLLLGVTDDYAVMFLHGGASNQFAMVPMNLLRGRKSADYVNTGMWSGKAIHDARRYAEVNVVASSAEAGFSRVPKQSELDLDARAAYLHYTPLETAHGLQFTYVPETGDVPLVADASSALFAVPIDVSKFGAIYASAQKNLGIVGMTLVIVRRDLIGHADLRTPTTFDYAVQERTGSRFTTPPVFAWYVAGLMLDWMRRQGGAAAVSVACRRRAELVYAALDASEFYATSVEADSRAVCSLPFRLADPTRTESFLVEAEKAGLHALCGHPSVGGFRASMYVGMPEAGAQALVEFLGEFERRYG